MIFGCGDLILVNPYVSLSLLFLCPQIETDLSADRQVKQIRTDKKEYRKFANYFKCFEIYNLRICGIFYLIHRNINPFLSVTIRFIVAHFSLQTITITNPFFSFVWVHDLR